MRRRGAGDCRRQARAAGLGLSVLVTFPCERKRHVALMELVFHLPRIDLRDYIRCYYFFTADQALVQPLCAEIGNIRVLVSGSARLRFADGLMTRCPSAFVIGPTTSAYVAEIDSGARVFGAGILPRGWDAILGVSAEHAADRMLDVTALEWRAGAPVIDAIQNARSISEMAAIADTFFARRLEQRARRVSAYPRALEAWITHGSDLELDRLVEMMDVSRRQTDRLAKRYFGASPKLLQRKYRALRAADMLGKPGGDWRAAAGESFYDQSHFIKEFRAFVGVTPQEYLNKQAQLTAISRAERKRIVDRHPLASL